MDGKTFELITTSESTKEAWDILHKVFGGLECKNLKKEESGRTLKRVRSQISSEDDHGDNNHLRALTLIIKTKEATPQTVERIEAKSSDCQVSSDLILSSHDNMIFHSSPTDKGSKGKTRELSTSKFVVPKTMQTEVFGSRKTI